MLPARRIDQQPTQEEVLVQEELLSPSQVSATGFGIPKPYTPPQPPEKPGDVPNLVAEWLNKEENPQSPATSTTLPPPPPLQSPTVL